MLLDRVRGGGSHVEGVREAWGVGASGLSSPGSAPLDPAARSHSPRGRGNADQGDRVAGQSIWEIRIPADHGVVAAVRVAGQREAGEEDLAAGGLLH